MAVVPTYASPNIGNYYIGRGIVSIKVQGESEFSDAGNCTQCEVTVKPTILPHFSSRVGTRFKDFTAVTEIEATMMCSLEEFTARNLAFALLGIPQESGVVSIDMFAQPQYYAAMQFVGTNTVGPQWSLEMPLVQLSPQKAISLIAQGSGTWGTIDLQCDVLKDPVTGQFCIATASDFT
jgi:hypothetical protein